MIETWFDFSQKLANFRFGLTNMHILSHRGFWERADEKNTSTAFLRSFEAGFGTETDIRDRLGELVISHDPAGHAAITVEHFLRDYARVGCDVPLALNIKADGLYRLLLPALASHGVDNFFVFDMSVPDARGWIDAGVPTFTRQSDIEPEPALYRHAEGVWLDAFASDWWDTAVIEKHLDAGKKVCVVSPELHGRDPLPVWRRLAEKAAFRNERRLMLCTDRPLAAKEAILG